MHSDWAGYSVGLGLFKLKVHTLFIKDMMKLKLLYVPRLKVHLIITLTSTLAVQNVPFRKC